MAATRSHARRFDISDEQVVREYERAGHVLSGAAATLGIHSKAVRCRLKRMQRDKVYDFEAARGFTIKGSGGAALPLSGTSTLYDADGKLRLQWIKTAANGKHSPEEWAGIVKDAFSNTEPVKRIPAPKAGAKHLLTVYPIGDHHTAAFAWGEECGEDYDLKIAERLLVSAAEHLVEQAPASDFALIVNVGDFFHVDNVHDVTARAGNHLDVDTRYAKMIRAGVRMLRTVIERAMAKHRRVRVINAIGNHDDVGSLWLSLALEWMYEGNPRVEIDASPAKFHYHQHGTTLIGVTHGDTLKIERLPGVMAADQAEQWGQTRHRYWLTGHIHQRKVLEFPGCMVESFRTLAGRDAWTTASGYRSGRDMTCIVFHDEHGEVARHRFDVGMLEGA